MTRRCGSDASTASRSDPAGRSQRRRSAAARAAMVILDTDHVSFLHHGGAGPGLRLLQRLRTLDPSEIATSIVSFEEQTRGWLSFVAKARTMAAEIEAYRRLHGHLDVFCGVRVVDFDASAA